MSNPSLQFHRSCTYSINLIPKDLEEFINKSSCTTLEPVNALIQSLFDGVVKEEKQNAFLTTLSSLASTNHKPEFVKTLGELTLSIPCTDLGGKIVKFIDSIDHSDYQKTETKVAVLALGYLLKSTPFEVETNRDIYNLGIQIITTCNTESSVNEALVEYLFQTKSRFTEGYIGYLARHTPLVGTVFGYHSTPNADG